MANLISGALTTVDRVKTAAKISSNNIDDLITRKINLFTRKIEDYCNKNFEKQSYEKIRSVKQRRQFQMHTEHAPIQSISKIEYRRGDVADPRWKEFDNDEYQVAEDGETGRIEFFSVLNSSRNSIRINYDAGYKIDFDNLTTDQHTLPLEVTEVCERAVIRAIQRTEGDHTTSEGDEGSSASFKNIFDKELKSELSNHRRTYLHGY